jgi:hypothetical protein
VGRRLQQRLKLPKLRLQQRLKLPKLRLQQRLLVLREMRLDV